MTFDELVSAAAEYGDLTKTEARRAVEATVFAIGRALRAGEEVRLPGLGTFRGVERKARTGRNPRTGEPVEIPAARGVKFSPAKALKETLNPKPRVGGHRRAG